MGVLTTNRRGHVYNFKSRPGAPAVAVFSGRPQRPVFAPKTLEQIVSIRGERHGWVL